MAAEDYINDCDFDPFLEEEPPGGWTGFNMTEYRAPRRVRINGPDVPGTVQLSSLLPGETFKFPNAVNAANVYMVIESQALSAAFPALSHYILLNTGRLYASSPTKRVQQVDVRVSVDVS